VHSAPIFQFAARIASGKSADHTSAVADTFNKAERSRIMAAVRSRGNKATELLLAAMFREAGVKGWRRHPRMLGRPDLFFKRIASRFRRWLFLARLRATLPNARHESQILAR